MNNSEVCYGVCVWGVCVGVVCVGVVCVGVVEVGACCAMLHDVQKIPEET